MARPSSQKIRKIVKNIPSRNFLTIKPKSLTTLSKESNINVNSLRRVNVLTTPLATIWQLSKVFGTSVEGFLNGKNLEKFTYKNLNFKFNNQIFIPFIPIKHFFEFLINAEEFINHREIFFFTNYQIELKKDLCYVCTFLKERQTNKRKHRLAIIELNENSSFENGDMVVFRHNKYPSLFFGDYIKTKESFKIRPQKVYKKPIFHKEEVMLIGKANFIFEINNLSEEDYFWGPINNLKTIKRATNKDDVKKMRKECSRVFFQNITKILAEKNISLNQLSRALGKNVSILHEAKNKFYSIRIETALNIAKFLNTNIDALLSGLESSESELKITNEKIIKNSILAPALSWSDFKQQSFYKHQIFSTPKIDDEGKVFVIKNNLEQSFDNGFHKDTIFVIFSNYNVEKAKFILLQQGKKLKIAKVISCGISKTKSIVYDKETRKFEDVKNSIMGEIKYILSPYSKI